MTDFRYREEAERELSKKDSRGGATSRSSVAWEIVIEKGNRFGTIRKLLRSLGVGMLGFESSVSYEVFSALSRIGAGLKPLRGLVEGLRAVKDADEIALIRQAVRRAEDAFRDIKPRIRAGRSELEIAGMLEERLKKRGCNRIPFDIIVASGDNAAMPHAKATEKRLSPGDLVVVDWGGEAEGYVSDMTRTLLLRGGDMTRKKGIYEAVLKANRDAISSVSPGEQGKIIDGTARESIGNAGYGEYFGHGTGHGVGLEVHELPRITWTKRTVVQEHMVFTVEPGIYLPGLGGVRIEDMVLVRSAGCEVLTTLPKNLEIIA